MKPYPGNSLRPLPFRSAADTSIQGSILLITLWVLFLLSIAAVMIGSVVRQKIVVVQRLDERARVRLIAQAGIMQGISEVKKIESPAYDSLQDPWANNLPSFKDVSFGGGLYNICYNEGENLCVQEPSLVSGFKLCWGVVDEERKININTADIAVLTRLFKTVPEIDETEAQDLAAAVIDWRDSDNSLASPGGAEDGYYTGLQYPYKCKNAPFESLDELLLVKGFSPANFRRIKGLVTVYGNGRVNINSARLDILLALGLRLDLAQMIISFRQGKDNVDGTEDDNVFHSASEIIPRLSQEYSLGAADISELSAVSEKFLAVSSNNFMVRCLTSLNKRANIRETLCVYDRNKDKIVYWRD